MVQAAHAALEGGLKLPCEVSEPSSLIVLQVKDVDALYDAREFLWNKDIDTITFFEPDWEYGDTAFCTEALIESQRPLLRRFRLWKP